MVADLGKVLGKAIFATASHEERLALEDGDRFS